MQPIEAQPRLYERNGHSGRLYERLSDAELVRKATSGDGQALDVLVARAQHGDEAAIMSAGTAAIGKIWDLPEAQAAFNG